MEFTVEKSALLPELELLQAVAEKTATIPILGNVKLAAEGEFVSLKATDLNFAMHCTCPAKIASGGEVTLPAARLTQYVKSLTAPELKIKLQKNDWVHVTSDRASARIAGMGVGSFPVLPWGADEGFREIPAAALGAALRRTILAVSDEQSRFTLCGALLILELGQMSLVATDGHRMALASCKRPEGGLEERAKILLPLGAMKLCLKLLAAAGDAEELVRIAADENHIFIRVGERLLTSRKLAGNFPDYARAMPQNHPHCAVVERAGFLGALERVGQFSDERSHAVRIHAAAGELKLQSSCGDVGESEESVPADYKGPAIEIGFNGAYLRDFLKTITEDRVSLLLKDGQAAGELRPVAGEDAAEYRYVVMPMRV